MTIDCIFRRAMKVWGLPRNPAAEAERARFHVSDDIAAVSPEEVHALALRFHDLCHTFGTLAVRRAEVPAVQAWMGHADTQTTMR